MTPLDDLIDGVHGLRGFILDARDDEERRQAARRVLRHRALVTGITLDLRNESVEAMIRVLYGTDVAGSYGSLSAVDPVRDTAVLLTDVRRSSGGSSSCATSTKLWPWSCMCCIPMHSPRPRRRPILLC